MINDNTFASRHIGPRNEDIEKMLIRDQVTTESLYIMK